MSIRIAPHTSPAAHVANAAASRSADAPDAEFANAAKPAVSGDRVDSGADKTQPSMNGESLRAGQRGAAPSSNAKSQRKRELSPEHFADPQSLTKENVKEYSYDALTKALEKTRQAHGECEKYVTSQNVKLGVLDQEHAAAETAAQKSEIQARRDAVSSKIAKFEKQSEILGANMRSLKNAQRAHSPMRAKYGAKLLKFGGTGTSVLNTSMMLLSVPSMFMMVKSFFPSKDKSDEGAPPPPPLTSDSGPQSFQPRGIVNHQANLMRQQQMQLAQLPPGMQTAFLQGPVAGYGQPPVPTRADLAYGGGFA